MIVIFRYIWKIRDGRTKCVIKNMCAINGQTHSFVSSDHYSLESGFVLRDFLEKRGRMDVQTSRANIVITTSRDCGSASWINRLKLF